MRRTPLAAVRGLLLPRLHHYIAAVVAEQSARPGSPLHDLAVEQAERAARRLAQERDAAERQLLARQREDPDHRPHYVPLVHGSAARLHVHPSAVVNDALFNLESGDVHVHAWAFFGHGVAVLTGTHDTSRRDQERQTAVPRAGRDVVVGRGAWIASRAVLLGPCSVGAHAVVAAGAVVVGDVPEGAVVAGVPARVVGQV